MGHLNDECDLTFLPKVSTPWKNKDSQKESGWLREKKKTSPVVNDDN